MTNFALVCKYPKCSFSEGHLGVGRIPNRRPNGQTAAETAIGGTSSCKHQLPHSFATGGFEYIHYIYHILYPRLLWMTIPKWVLCWYVRTPATSFHCNLMNTSAHAEGWSERGGEARSERGDQTGISGRYRETCMKRWESDPVRSFLFFFVLIFSWWIVATSRWAAIAALHPEWGNHRQKSTIHIWAFRLLKDIRRLAKSGVSSKRFPTRLGVVCHDCVSHLHSPPPSLLTSYWSIAFKMWNSHIQVGLYSLIARSQNDTNLPDSWICGCLRVSCGNFGRSDVHFRCVGWDMRPGLLGCRDAKYGHFPLPHIC